jgi:hypothetical protein
LNFDVSRFILAAIILGSKPEPVRADTSGSAHVYQRREGKIDPRGKIDPDVGQLCLGPAGLVLLRDFGLVLGMIVVLICHSRGTGRRPVVASQPELPSGIGHKCG